MAASIIMAITAWAWYRNKKTKTNETQPKLSGGAARRTAEGNGRSAREKRRQERHRQQRNQRPGAQFIVYMTEKNNRVIDIIEMIAIKNLRARRTSEMSSDCSGLRRLIAESETSNASGSRKMWFTVRDTQRIPLSRRRHIMVDYNMTKLRLRMITRLLVLPTHVRFAQVFATRPGVWEPLFREIIKLCSVEYAARHGFHNDKRVLHDDFVTFEEFVLTKLREGEQLQETLESWHKGEVKNYGQEGRQWAPMQLSHGNDNQFKWRTTDEGKTETADISPEGIANIVHHIVDIDFIDNEQGVADDIANNAQGDADVVNIVHQYDDLDFIDNEQGGADYREADVVNIIQIVAQGGNEDLQPINPPGDRLRPIDVVELEVD